nr:putative non-structural protein NS5 [Tamana bat virus]
GRQYKFTLNKLNKHDFLQFKGENVYELENKDDFPSRGFAKMDWMIKSTLFQPRGFVVDGGCGAGGFSARMCFEKPVAKILGYTIGKDKHHTPDLNGKKVYKKFNWEIGDLFKKRIRCDTFVMDIGESHPNQEIEAIGDLKRLNWFKENVDCKNWCIKIMVPTHEQVLHALPKGSTLIRNPWSRNSTLEMYCVPGSNEPGRMVSNVIKVLNQRINRTSWQGSIMKKLYYPEDEEQVGSTKVNYIIEKEKLQNFTLQEERRVFNHWKCLGSVEASRKGSSGQNYNSIITAITSGLRKVVPSIEHWMLTSTKPEDTFSTFLRKVDQPPQPLGNYKSEFQEKFKWVQQWYKSKNKHGRILTNEEVISKFKSDGALGFRCQHYGSIQEALENPNFFKDLEAEEINHLHGKCTRGVFDVIGKKEKKDLYGKPKGSRLIMYLDLVERFLEHKYLGFLNSDHWCHPENLPSGVSAVSPYEYPRMIVEKCKIDPRSDLMENWVIQDDTAGWDTRLHDDVLECEQSFLCDFAESEEHIKHILRIYKNYRNPMIKLTDDSGTRDLILIGKGQRCSGTVVTYSMNTITNTVVQMMRMQEVLELSNEECLHKMMVSGDDCLLVLKPEEAIKVSKSLKFINSTGFIRKDVPRHVPSPVVKDWKNISFCSHGIAKGRMQNGEYLWTLGKNEAEIIGKAQLQIGAFGDEINEQSQAKAMALYLLLTFPMRRDIRLIAKAIMACCQEGLVPMGKVKEPLIWGEPWLDSMDIVNIINKIYGTNFYTLEEVPYVRHSLDMERGSTIHTNERSNWKKFLLEKMVPDLSRRNNTAPNMNWLVRNGNRGNLLV